MTANTALAQRRTGKNHI